MACDSAGAARVEADWLAHEYDAASLEHVLAPDFVHALARFARLDIRIVNGVAIATGVVAASDSAQTDRLTVETPMPLSTSR